jgi:hypothetical protein
MMKKLIILTIKLMNKFKLVFIYFYVILKKMMMMNNLINNKSNNKSSIVFLSILSVCNIFNIL